MRVDPNYISNLSQAVNLSSEAEQKLTNELSSGLRVAALSDDPVAAAHNVALSSTISRLDTFVQNESRQQSLLQVTDSALGEVVARVTSTLSLAVSAASGTLSPANLSAIASQVADARDNILSLANTSYLGHFLFSGSQGSTKPFQLDTTTTPATAAYQGDNIAQTLETPDGQKVPLNVSGSAVFAAPGANLFGALNQLVADLATGSSSAIQADSSALTAALGKVTEQRSIIGGSLSRLAATSGYAQTQSTLFQAEQSQSLSADPAKVATDLRTAEVQHQALLSVIASLSKTNLFDFLH